MLATNRISFTSSTSSNLSHSSPNCWQQIVLLPLLPLLPIFDTQAQIAGNKSYFFHFFQSLTLKPKLLATNRTSSTSSNLWNSSPNCWQQIVFLSLLPLLPIFGTQARIAGNKSYFFHFFHFFQSLTLKSKLVAINSAVDPNCRLGIVFYFSRVSSITDHHKNTKPGDITIFT